MVLPSAASDLLPRRVPPFPEVGSAPSPSCASLLPRRFKAPVAAAGALGSSKAVGAMGVFGDPGEDGDAFFHERK